MDKEELADFVAWLREMANQLEEDDRQERARKVKPAITQGAQATL